MGKLEAKLGVLHPFVVDSIWPHLACVCELPYRCTSACSTGSAKVNCRVPDISIHCYTMNTNWCWCRWKATALRQGDWESWFQTQMKTANKKPEKGLYISLRMDGRVRGSGTGSPPWDRLAVALPPVSGSHFWSLLLFMQFWEHASVTAC